ncbi:MAG: PD40 domain-containing protein [Bacteriovorax sp.]|nr:PD40 domain-containing protein [Bacteriovorax sp.]
MKKLFLVILVLLSAIAFAQDDNLSIVAVGEATLEKDKMVIQDPYTSGSLTAAQKSSALEIVKLLRNDFAFYQKKFYLVESAPNNTTSRQTTNYDYWNGKGIRYLGTASVDKSGVDMKVTLVFEDIKNKKQIYNSSMTASINSMRRAGHELANNVYKVIIGKNSIFNSKITFVSDRNTRGRKTVKEVYMMDFDGKNVVQLTNHGGIVMSPTMSADGHWLVYSLISNTGKKRNNDLYLMDMKTKTASVLSNKEGVNSGAVFLTGKHSIAFTLTASGNAEIYEMNINNKELRKITNHFASDVDPSITADGTLMTFLSDRPGKAMIYSMDPRGTEKNVKRISFVGQFNATPRFSPDGKEIVFSSWLDNCFDLFRISSDGQGLSRLTKDFGSNEDPSYSNDGEFITFTSQRVISRVRADQNIYIMDRDGGILGAITSGFGNCISPRWYNFQ